MPVGFTENLKTLQSSRKLLSNNDTSNLPAFIFCLIDDKMYGRLFSLWGTSYVRPILHEIHRCIQIANVLVMFRETQWFISRIHNCSALRLRPILFV